MPKPMEAPDNNEFAATLAGLVSSGQNEGVWRDLVNALPAAIYITDPRGRIIFYNEAAVAMWGCRPEIGKSEFCGSWKLRTATTRNRKSSRAFGAANALTIMKPFACARDRPVVL